MNYAYTLFYDMVAAPAIALDIAYELQNFLRLDDGQRKSHIFANMFVQYDTDKYAFLFYDGLGNFIIDTNGCEMDSPGKEWDIYIEAGGQLFEYFKVEIPYYSRYSSGINLKMKCRGDGQWEISGNSRDGVCRLTLADDNQEERNWLVCTAGSETEAGATGIRSDYCTCGTMEGEGDFGISFQKYAADNNQACSFNGTFLVLISSFDEIKERALIFGKPGFAVNCITETVE